MRNNKICCDEFMKIKGVYDVDTKSESFLFTCNHCGAYLLEDIIKKNNPLKVTESHNKSHKSHASL